MGLPARDLRKTPERSRPRLRLVKGTAASRKPAASRVRARKTAGSDAFALACVLLVGLALFGLGRVMLAARATEASLLAAELRQEIKAERADGERLEVDVSALTVPSRIESIAGATMHMAEASSIEYMAMESQGVDDATEPNETNVVPAAVEDEPVVDDGVSGLGWLDSVMDMAAGEAHMLLVGDVGLASPE